MSTEPETEEPIDLETVIQAFQQAVARASESTVAAAVDVPAIRYGQRPVYLVQRLAVEIQVGTEVRRVERQGRVEGVILVTSPAPGQTPTSLKFEVSAAPPEAPLTEPLLQLSIPEARRDGQLLGDEELAQSGDRVKVVARVHNSAGLPVPAIPVWLELLQLAGGPARDNPGAPDAERWREMLPGQRWLGSSITDDRGAAQFSFEIPSLAAERGDGTTLIRVRGRAVVPVTPGSPNTVELLERQPRFLTVRLPAADEEGEEAGEESVRAFTARGGVAPRSRGGFLPPGEAPAPTGLTLEGTVPVPLEEAAPPAEDTHSESGEV